MKLALPLTVLLALSACTGGGVPLCDATTCSGCCDPTGVCQGGTGLDFCGQSGAACVACTTGQTCTAGSCTAIVCVPTTCQQAGKNCGQIEDGCGATVQCGTCGNGESCGGAGMANVCGPGTCSPKTCTSAAAQCGKLSDGCSMILECGTCVGGDFCGGAGPNKCGSCMPKTCAALGKNCGMVSDGCMGMLTCGTCGVAGESCGGGGTPNVCGKGACTAKTCAELNKNCGMVADGCNNMIACGTCASPLSCGGAGTANVCGAMCAPGCPTGFTCDPFGVCGGGSLTGLVLNEIGHAVSGTIQVNGAAPVQVTPAYCTLAGNAQDPIAQIRFTEATKGYSALAYVRCNSNSGFSTLLPPGTYEVRIESSSYSGNAGINLLPVSYVADPALVISAPTTGLLFNEVGHAVSGTIQVNGATPVQSTPAYCTLAGNAQDPIAQIRFREMAKGYNALAYVRCNSSSGFSTLLPPGTYEVRVESASYSGNAGINLLPVSYVANAALVISAPVSNLVLNEVGHAVSGTIQVNGAAPVQSTPAYCTLAGNAQDPIAQVRFTDSTKGYSALAYVRCTSSSGFTTLLPPGTYEVRVESSSYSGNAGINLLPVSYVANTALVITAPVSGLVLNEVGHAVSGTIQVNGATPVQSTPAYCTLGGNAQDPIAQVRFRDSAKGYNALAYVRCNSSSGFSTLLPPGTYEVRVESSSYSGNAGINLLPVSYVANSALVISAPVSGLVLNEVGHAVSGTIQVNGAAPVQSTPAYCTLGGNAQDPIAQVRFTDSTKGYSALAYVRCTSSSGFTTLLPPGTYEVRVESSSYSGNAGINLLPVSYVANTALVISAPVSGLVLNEVGHAVSGTIQVNGATPVQSTPAYCTLGGNAQDPIAQIRFRDSAKGYNALAYVRCNSSSGFSTLLPPGVYEVRVESSSYSGNAGINLLPVSYVAISQLKVP